MNLGRGPHCLAIAAIGVVACICGCSKSKATTSPAPSATVTAAVSAASAAVDAAPPLRTLKYDATVANFRKEVLDECVDLTWEATPFEDAGADVGTQLEKAFAAFVKDGFKGTTKVAAHCEKQFADRTALATCSVGPVAPPKPPATFKAPASLIVTMIARYYDFGTLSEDDTFMNQCMKMGGKWSAVPRDSEEWRKAQLEDMRRRHRKAFNKLTDDP